MTAELDNDATCVYGRRIGAFYRELRPAAPSISVPGLSQVRGADDRGTPFHCFVCGSHFRDVILLREHESVVHRFYRCPHSGCHQVFPHEKTLVLHERNFHHSLRCLGCNADVRGAVGSRGRGVNSFYICGSCNFGSKSRTQRAQTETVPMDDELDPDLHFLLSKLLSDVSMSRDEETLAGDRKVSSFKNVYQFDPVD